MNCLTAHDMSSGNGWSGSQTPEGAKKVIVEKQAATHSETERQRRRFDAGTSTTDSSTDSSANSSAGPTNADSITGPKTAHFDIDSLIDSTAHSSTDSLTNSITGPKTEFSAGFKTADSIASFSADSNVGVGNEILDWNASKMMWKRIFAQAGPKASKSKAKGEEVEVEEEKEEEEEKLEWSKSMEEKERLMQKREEEEEYLDDPPAVVKRRKQRLNREKWQRRVAGVSTE